MLLLSFGDVKAQEAFTNSILVYSTDNQQVTSRVADTVFTVRDIIVRGNKRTRKSTILREMPFQVADSYLFADITEKLELAKRQLMNTNLFRNVTVNLRTAAENQMVVEVDVKSGGISIPNPLCELPTEPLASGTKEEGPWNT